MFLQLLTHQWKESARSAFWQNSIGFRILIGFSLLMLALYCVAIGLFMDVLLKMAFPNQDLLLLVSKGLLYYLTIDLILRFFLQKLPVLSIQPYLILPIKRARLFNFLVLKSVVNPFNLLPLLVFVPFSLKLIILSYPVSVVISWLVAVIALVLANNFIAFSIKKYIVVKPFLALSLIAFVGLFIYADYAHWINASNTFGTGLVRISNAPYWLIIPLLWARLCFSITKRLLRQNAYLDDLETRKNNTGTTTRFRFLQRYGIVGELMQLELNLHLRNKRTKSALIAMLPGILIIVYTYTSDQHGPFFLFGMTIFLSSILMSILGQMLFAQEASYFHLLMTLNIPFKSIFEAKYRLLVLANLISFILFSPILYFSYHYFFILLAGFFINSGINAHIMLYASLFNDDPIDMSRSTFFNYQGVNITQFLVMLPLIGIPTSIYLPFRLYGLQNMGIVAIGAIGLVGILLHKYSIQFLANQLKKRKHILTTAYK
ncbi:MAG: hypothetical protein CL843_07255 [Crocinitomicaceae bacterium]|nr:hypothetical protein [Crocinitomicaceae bacterium]|tara:strand:+ start:637 stop:2100 length:1464 start_codon:yes stop_codon:yes gene_type:complete